MLTSVLDNLVSDDTISQEQEDAIQSAFESIFDERKKQGNSRIDSILDNMVSAGTITQEQEEAIQSIFQSNI